MTRNVNKFAPSQIDKLPPGLHNDGGNLYLNVKKSGTRSWVFRYRDKYTKRLRDKGLGSSSDVSLKKARQKATLYRADIQNGIDPIDAADQAIADARTTKARKVTFGFCANAYIESRKAGWKNKKHAQQWVSTLDTYCSSWKNLPVSEIDVVKVLGVLKDKWDSNTETASRVRQRIEAVLDWATTLGHRHGENPARWRGHMKNLLIQPSKLKSVKHRPALPYSEMSTFFGELSSEKKLSAKALTLQILTATRPGEAIGAIHDEFDMVKKIWTIPARRMKANREHKVPLTTTLIELLNSIPKKSQYLFPGEKGGPMTTAAMLNTMKLLRPGLTCHGFRSTFRDWAADHTTEADVAEAALAHVIKNKSEAAYRRTDFLEKRVKLMQLWSDFCFPGNISGSN